LNKFWLGCESTLGYKNINLYKTKIN